MEPHPTGVGRRDFLKAAGLGASAPLALGGIGAGVVRGTGAAAAATTTLALAATDGYITVPGRRGRPALHLRVHPGRPTATVDQLDHDVQGPRADQRADPRRQAERRHQDHADQPRPGPAARPDRLAHDPLARLRRPSPLNDGVPEVSVAVPIGKQLTYFYRPHREGTYMYHCHFEDVEHVQMGMTGIVFVRPLQDGTTLGGVHQVRVQRRRRLDRLPPAFRDPAERVLEELPRRRPRHPGVDRRPTTTRSGSRSTAACYPQTIAAERRSALPATLRITTPNPNYETRSTTASRTPR